MSSSDSWAGRQDWPVEPRSGCQRRGLKAVAASFRHNERGLMRGGSRQIPRDVIHGSGRQGLKIQMDHPVVVDPSGPPDSGGHSWYAIPINQAHEFLSELVSVMDPLIV